MVSRFFIDRPIFAAVMSIFLVLAGLLAMRILPIAQYPEIAPPVVTVRAIYPGASAQTLEQTVAAPLENTINGVENLMYMSSTSASNGVLEIQVTFEIGTDVDQAALNVNNRVKQAEPRLPEEVRRQGVTVEKGSSAFLQVIAFLSPDGRMSDIDTSNYVTLNVLDRLKRIPGTTNVQIFGAKDYAMRIWLRPDRMAELGVTASEIAAAIREQNAQFAAGKIGQPPTGDGQELVYTINAQGRLSTPEAFGNIILRTGEGTAILRLKDVARIELGSRDYDFTGLYNGKPATLVGIFLQPGANSLAVGDEVKATLATLARQFPESLSYTIPYDTTRFVEVSIREVIKTLAEAILLVVLVVFLFLQNWRATLIPVIAVPVSLLGTFVGLHLLGYTINTLTLFGMVLSIGIVVDDAIVVLENIERIMHEEQLAAREAALKAMREVTGPVVAIVLVLCAVFIPIAFLGGLTGELYRQFAVTITIAVILSGFVALTLTPALSVLILQNQRRHPGRFFAAFNRGFDHFTGGYLSGVGFLLRRTRVAITLYLLMVAAALFLWNITPGSLVPSEDQGYYIGAVYLPDGSSLSRTEAVTAEVIEIMRSDPDAEHVVAFAGLDFLGGGFRNSAATIFVAARHWDQRQRSTDEMVGQLMARSGGIQEAMVIAFGPPPIFGLGNAGGFELYVQNRGEGGPKALAQASEQLLAELRKDPRIVQPLSLWRSRVPQLYIDLDRAKAKLLGVDIDSLFTTVAATLGTFYVNDFNKFGRTWQVQMSAEPGYRATPRDIGALYVPTADGSAQVPLAALAKVEYTSGPETLDRYNNVQAVKIYGNAAPGISSGQALEIVEEIADRTLPPGFSYEWTSASFQEKRSTGTANLALGLAVLMVFLILAAQYEKWSLPIAVQLALPFGTFGALAAVWLRGLSNDVYFQIGLVTLLGLAAKNAILIVEYALLKNEEGYSAVAAAMEAARLRFRPILMTSLAFILGVLPLAISTGAGAGARHAVGTGVAGGMLAATFLAIFFIPLFYRLVTDRRLSTYPEEFEQRPHRAPHRSPHTPSHHPGEQPRPEGGDGLSTS